MEQRKYLRIALAMPNLKIGDISSNAAEIKKYIINAGKNNTGLLVFPPAALTGRYIGELGMHDFFYERQLEELYKLAKATSNRKITVILPCYMIIKGMQVFGNMILADGEIREFNFLQFDRDIEPGVHVHDDLVIAYNASYNLGNDITMEFTECGVSDADLALYIDDSKHYLGKPDIQRKKIQAITRERQNTVIYMSCATSETVTDGVFSGDMFACEKGEILAEGKRYDVNGKVVFADVYLYGRTSKKAAFEEKLSLPMELGLLFFKGVRYRKYAKNPFLPKDEHERELQTQQILEMQVAALSRRLSYTKAEKAVIGVSGGLDSTLALIVSVNAMKKIGKNAEDVIAITMPGQGTSNKTKDFADTLMDSLGVSQREIPITDAVSAHFSDINHDESNINAAYENAQARERTQILMDIANDVNGVVVGTGDMSELALGWCTYNGDHMSMYAVNSGIPKTVIREMVHNIAKKSADKKLAKALKGIISLPISPELIPANTAGEIVQLTENEIGPYELHDFFLYHSLQNSMSPQEILHIANITFREYSEAEIKKYLKIFYTRFSSQQFKRNCMPEGVSIFDISLSPRGGFSMPGDFTMDEWLQALN